MAIYGIFGGLGSGKTTLAHFYLNEFLQEKKDLVVNTHTQLPSYYITMEDLIDKAKNDTLFFMNKVLFIDELHLLMESRRSSATLNLDFAQNLLIQLGKLDCEFIYTSQLISQVDLRIVNMTKYFFWTTLVDDIGNPILEDKRIKNQPVFINVDYLIRFNDLKIDTGHFILNPINLFKMFDTREIINLDRETYLKK